MARYPAAPRLTLIAALALATGTLAACQETPSDAPILSPGDSWQVLRIGEIAAPDGVTLEVVEAGRLAGQAPCNRWFAGFTQTGTSLEIGAAGATRMACLAPDRAEAETAFFAALESSTVIAPGPEAGQVTLSDGTRALLVLGPPV